MKILPAIAAAVASLALLSPSSAMQQADEKRADEKQTGGYIPEVGPLCIAAILYPVAEFSRRCMPERSAEDQAKLQDTMLLLDQFILADPDWDADRLAAFKDQQNYSAMSDEKFCQPSALEFVRPYLMTDADTLRRDVQGVIDRYDRAVWGRTCL